MFKVILKENYPMEVKNVETLYRAIQLMRIVNSLHNNTRIHLELYKSEGVDYSLMNYLFTNQAAILYEAIKTFISMGKKLNNLSSYKEREDEIEIFRQEIINNKSFTNTVLRTIRDKIAFHFDKEIIEEIAEEFIRDISATGKKIILISGKTEKKEDMIFNIANDIDFNFINNLISKEIVGFDFSGDPELKYADEIMKKDGLLDNDKPKLFIASVIYLSVILRDVLETIISELVADIGNGIKS